MIDLELTKNKLLKFYEQNINLLILDTPFEKWADSVILFSSNDSVKGKVYFKLKTIEFKLKHKVWMPYTVSGIRDYTSEHNQIIVKNKLPWEKIHAIAELQEIDKLYQKSQQFNL